MFLSVKCYYYYPLHGAYLNIKIHRLIEMISLSFAPSPIIKDQTCIEVLYNSQFSCGSTRILFLCIQTVYVSKTLEPKCYV